MAWVMDQVSFVHALMANRGKQFKEVLAGPIHGAGNPDDPLKGPEFEPELQRMRRSGLLAPGKQAC